VVDDRGPKTHEHRERMRVATSKGESWDDSRQTNLSYRGNLLAKLPLAFSERLL
jgi:hypothetical protein